MKLDKEKILHWVEKFKLVEAKDYFIQFIKNPIVAVKQIPDWSWPTILIIAAILSAVSTFLSGMLAKKFLYVFIGPIIGPIGFIAAVLIISSFFYYIFYFTLDRQVDFKKLYTALVIVAIPTLAANILSSLLMPVQILGFAASCLLTVKALIYGFHLPKKRINQIIAAIFIIYVLTWLIDIIDFTKKEEAFNIPATKESLDTLEKELTGK